MRIHLGHHFYGAGNLGDDFMLAGFLQAMRGLAPDATFTASIPFALEPVRQRFPEIDWQPYDLAIRAEQIAHCDAWLGIGGSPFQSAQSRWFVDHLTEEVRLCQRHRKPMYYLGVGVQTAAELAVPEVRTICAAAEAIWTRDVASAERLAATLPQQSVIRAAADLAHVFFRASSPPPIQKGRVTLVSNFDYDIWSGQTACLEALDRLHPSDRVWLAQETRTLPGAERALFASLPDPERARWRLVVPAEEVGVEATAQRYASRSLTDILRHWPSGEWLVTSRYHAALAGAWAGSKIVVIGINEKLQAAARTLHAPIISPDAEVAAVADALDHATVSPRPEPEAVQAQTACAEFVSRFRSR